MNGVSGKPPCPETPALSLTIIIILMTDVTLSTSISERENNLNHDQPDQRHKLSVFHKPSLWSSLMQPTAPTLAWCTATTLRISSHLLTNTLTVFPNSLCKLLRISTLSEHSAEIMIIYDVQNNVILTCTVGPILISQILEYFCWG